VAASAASGRDKYGKVRKVAGDELSLNDVLDQRKLGGTYMMKISMAGWDRSAMMG